MHTRLSFFWGVRVTLSSYHKFRLCLKSPDSLSYYLVFLSFCKCFKNDVGYRRIADDIAEFLPNLTSLYMANNIIQELKDLEPLANLKKLEFLSLLGNPVTTRKHYRLFLIHKAPQVGLSFAFFVVRLLILSFLSIDCSFIMIIIGRLCG